MDIFTLIRQQAEQRPRHLAFCNINTGQELTYAELVARARTTAVWLAKRGCLPGERCGLIAANGCEFMVSALGILAAGLCIAPMGTFLPEEERDFVIESAGLHWVLRPEIELAHLPFAKALDKVDDRNFLSCRPGYIRFTSGTTGRRKGVLLGHQAIVKRLRAANERLKITPADRVWFTLPMADHFVVSVLLYLSRGATVVTADRPEDYPTVAQRHSPTVIYGSPDFYESLARSRVTSLDSLRLAICTTATPKPELTAEFSGKFGRDLNPALGIIEVGLCTLNTSAGKTGSVGTPMPAYDVRLIGEDREPVGIGEIGELHVAGPGLLDAYLAPWRPLERLLTTYGFPTGDFARRDQEGFLYLAGRGKNRLEIEGLKFFCEEVEGIINTLPGVRESRVFVDPESGVLSAQVVGSPRSSEKLCRMLLQKIDSRKVPKKIELVDKLARTPNGKLQR